MHGNFRCRLKLLVSSAADHFCRAIIDGKLNCRATITDEVSCGATTDKEVNRRVNTTGIEPHPLVSSATEPLPAG
jgi:hypothetical protein